MNDVALHSGYLPILSLCAGVGGLELGVHLACPGARTVGFVEREAYAAATLVARMEESALDPAPVWDDLVAFDGRPWAGRVSLVTAGFPCQPFSVAGQRKGTADERWLWDDIARILREVGPRYVLLENVSGLLQFRGGIGRVLGNLAEMGFDTEWGCFRASSVGAPHRRERVFIFAARRDYVGEWTGVSDPVGAAVRVESGRSRRADGSGAAELGHVGEGPLADDHGAGLDRGAEPDLEAAAGQSAPRRGDALGQDSGVPGDGSGEGVADAGRPQGRRKKARRPTRKGKAAARTGGGLADAAGEREREPHDEAGALAREGARPGAGGGGGGVADAAGDGHEPAGDPRERGTGPSDGSGPLADAAHEDERTGLGQQAADGAGGEPGAVGCGEELAHAEGDGGGVEHAVAERGSAAGPQRGGAELADSPGGGTGAGEQSGRVQGAEQRGEGLADPAGAGLPLGDRAGVGAAGERDAESQRGGERLADAAGGSARDAGARREASERGGDHEGLADADGPGLPGGEQRGACGEGEGAGAHGSTPELCGARGEFGEPGDGLVGLPAFPPGPSDREFWGALLAEWPELAPAVGRVQPAGAVEDPARVPGGERAGRERVLEAGAEGRADSAGGGEAPEPALRGLAHGLAAALACRADALRAAGNGVVGLQAAAALVVLARRLGVNPGVWPDLWDALNEIEDHA